MEGPIEDTTTIQPYIIRKRFNEKLKSSKLTVLVIVRFCWKLERRMCQSFLI